MVVTIKATCIYGLFDPRKPELIMYVGKGTDKRANYHWKKFCRNGSAVNSLLRDWLKKILEAGVVPCWHFLEENVIDWQTAERKWIAYWREKNPDLCNVADGGNAIPIESARLGGQIGGLKNKGRKLSEAQRLAFSQSNLGRICTEETKKKIGESNRGKKRSIESRIKMSEAKKGKLYPEERCLKMSASMLGKNKGKVASEETRRKLSESHKGQIPAPTRGGHNRWHAKKGIVNPECQYCRPDFFDIWEGQVA